jgi:hypothetical protein
VAFQNPADETIERLPDPEWDRIEQLEHRVHELESALAAMPENRPALRSGTESNGSGAGNQGAEAPDGTQKGRGRARR